MAAYVHDTSFFSRRALVLLTIILFHILLVYLMASGPARKAVQVIAPPIQTEIVEEIETREEPPPPPPPELERPPVEVPPPEVSIEIPVETRTTAITDVTDKPVERPPPPPPPPPVKRTGPKFDSRRSPSTDEYYPPTSRRLGEEGTATVGICIGPDGRVTGDPEIDQGSGSSRLDEAALKFAKRTRWSPATENGKPVEICSKFNVKFVLTD